jgi:enamine deaminase RidA (YjgF/YER057c/UK114 family)
MTVHFLNPEGLLQPQPYHHVSVASGTRHVHVAGQIAWDDAGAVVAPGDLAGQTAQALRNAARGLAGADASFTDVVRLRFFVTDWVPEKMGAFLAGVEAVAAELGIPQPLPPTSLIGVDILYKPEFLVEVEAYAVLD